MSFFTEMLTKEQYEAAQPVIRQAIPLLEKASTSDKFLLALSILDYVDSGSRRDYPMDFAISYQDGDGLLGEGLPPSSTRSLPGHHKFFWPWQRQSPFT
jgi:hypothetical protein